LCDTSSLIYHLSGLDSDIDEAKNKEHAVYSIRNIIFKEEDSEKENELDEKHISEDLNKLSLRHRAKDLTEADVLNSSPKTNNDEKTDQNVEKDSDAKVSFKSSKEKKRAIDRDPLHWFGLLVSPSLRISQQHFKTGKFPMNKQQKRYDFFNTSLT
jgi:hypothetical protein